MKDEIEYDDNITIYPKRQVSKYPYNFPIPYLSLEEDEWLVLMVTDNFNTGDPTRFYDYGERWIGLERTGDRIYISKGRKNGVYPFSIIASGRGVPMLAKVKDPSKCCILGE